MAGGAFLCGAMLMKNFAVWILLSLGCTLLHANDNVAGKAVYTEHCSMCHMPDGKGLPSVFPPLAQSDFFKKAEPASLVKIVTNGLSGALVVNGVTYNSVMSPVDLSDEDVAKAINYVSESLNAGKPLLSAEQVKKIRAGN